jgi:hypothetical protein
MQILGLLNSIEGVPISPCPAKERHPGGWSCSLKREFCSRFALVATVSAFCWPWAFGCKTTHDHRKQRGDRGFPYWDIKGGNPGFAGQESTLASEKPRFPLSRE